MNEVQSEQSGRETRRKNIVITYFEMSPRPADEIG